MSKSLPEFVSHISVLHFPLLDITRLAGYAGVARRDGSAGLIRLTYMVLNYGSQLPKDIEYFSTSSNVDNYLTWEKGKRLMEDQESWVILSRKAQSRIKKN